MENSMSTQPRKYTRPRMLQMVRASVLTPRLKRIVFGGDLEDFPTGSDGYHIKLFFPRKNQTRPVLPTLGPDGPIWPPPDQKPITRTFTIQHFDHSASELHIDFVIHDHGTAGRWARHAKPGDHLGLAGPGNDPFPRGYTTHLIAGDLSASPAIAAFLKTLPSDARATVFMEVPEPSDRLEMPSPADIAIHWFYLKQRPSASNQLLEAVRKTPISRQDTAAIIAGESSAVVAIRDYLRDNYGMTKRNLYAVPYWQDGSTEEAYHDERHRIMDQNT